MKRIHIISAVLALFTFQNIFGQSDSTEKNTMRFKVGLNYNSGLNYYGRTDSLKSTGVFPMAELWFTKDIYVNAAPVFVNNAVQSMEYAGTVTSLGYLHTTDKWIANLYVLKPFYKQSSQLVQSALRAQTGASFSALNKILNFTFGGDVKFSDKMDFGATAGLDHLVKKEFKKQDVLVIDPSFYVYAGTQNFSASYTKKKAGLLFFPGNTEQVTENVTRFNLLAYELSVPLIYVKGKWMALLTPSYILPQNLVKDTEHPELSETGQNLFYATVGLKYSF
jgi:hypothetical protein